MDLLEDHLVRARASGAVFARSVARAPWGLELAGAPELAVHAVLRGRVHLWLDDPADALELVAGDVVLVRGDLDHHLAHEPGAPTLGLEAFAVRHRDDEHTGSASAEAPSMFLCGGYRFAGDVGRGLLDALPPVLPLSAAPGDPLRAVVELLSRELAVADPGQGVVLDRLLDVVLVQAIRAWFNRPGSDAPRWYEAARDPRLGPALRAMHDDASRSWTVGDLAAISGLSRATFARSFHQSLGQAPMQYLTGWRMTLARDLLRSGGATLTQIADQTGYASPYAFAAAFRRHHGEPPGRWRTLEQHRSATPTATTRAAAG